MMKWSTITVKSCKFFHFRGYSCKSRTQLKRSITVVIELSSFKGYQVPLIYSMIYYGQAAQMSYPVPRLGITGVYIIFLILLKNKDCGYSLEPPHRGGSNEYSQSMF